MGHRTPPRSRFRSESGVTAVELIVVIGLVVLLIVIAVTSVDGIRDRQRSTACKSELAEVQTAVETFRARPGSQQGEGAPPRDLAALARSSLVDADVGQYVAYSRSRSGGRWVVRYTNGPKGNCIAS